MIHYYSFYDLVTNENFFKVYIILQDRYLIFFFIMQQHRNNNLYFLEIKKKLTDLF